MVYILGSTGFIGSQLLELDGNSFTSGDCFLDEEKLNYGEEKLDDILFLRSRNDQGDFHERNINGDLLILRSFIKRNRIKNLIYVSTGKVYGRHPKGVITKERINLDSEYARYHLEREQVLLNEFSDLNCRTVILRPFNVFGAKSEKVLKRSSLIPLELILQGLATRSIQVRTNGNARINFMSITQLRTNVLEALKLESGIFNLCSDWYPTVREIAEKVKTKLSLHLNCPVTVNYDFSDSRHYESFSIDGDDGLSKWSSQKTISDFDESISQLISLVDRNREKIK